MCGCERKDLPLRRTSRLNAAFLLDVELWDLGRRELRTRKLEQVSDYIDARGGEVLDRYVGPSITMLRTRLSGAVARTLLSIEDIATIDLPPEPDVATGEALIWRSKTFLSWRPCPTTRP